MSTDFRVPGPCKVSYGGEDCGYTKGGITIRTTTNWKPIITDEFGTEPADFIFAGKSLTIDLVLVDTAILGKALDQSSTVSVFVIGPTANDATGVGELTSKDQTVDGTMALPLIITERDGSTVWTAPIATPMDPEIGRAHVLNSR